MKLRRRKLPNGIEVFFHSRSNLDVLEQEMFEGNVYTQHGIELKEGDCIFDVGANIGFFVLFLNEQLKDASVFSFEPIPETFALLQRNSDQNNHLKLNLFNCGLASEAGQATFRYFPAANVCSTMDAEDSIAFRKNSRDFILQQIREFGRIPRWFVDHTPAWLWWPTTELIRRIYHRQVPVVCQLRTISDVIDEHQIERIDCLKIDTEGAEMEVLRGMREAHWPLVQQAVIETHDGPDSAKEVVELLQRHGFYTQVDSVHESLGQLSLVYATRTKQNFERLDSGSDVLQNGKATASADKIFGV